MSSTPRRGPRDARPGRPGDTGRPQLDPRAPLVVDTRELGRRAGSRLERTAEVPAPEDLGTPLIGVPAGSPLRLDLRLESVVEGVLVTARVRGRLEGECGRCLEPVQQDLDVELQELYAYPERLADLGEEADEEALVLDGDLLDLEPALRDAVVLDLPLSPVCSEDCAGLTLTGEKRAAGEAEDAPPVDPRWAGLAALADRPEA